MREDCSDCAAAQARNDELYSQLVAERKNVAEWKDRAEIAESNELQLHRQTAQLIEQVVEYRKMMQAPAEPPAELTKQS